MQFTGKKSLGIIMLHQKVSSSIVCLQELSLGMGIRIFIFRVIL